MTIDLTTPILTTAPLDVAALPQRFRGNAYDDATCDRFWAACVALATATDVRLSIVLAQVAHETGWFTFTGDVQPAQFNLAGLGATGGVAGASFPDIETGLRAVYAHHLVYTLGEIAHWPPAAQSLAGIDPRYDAVLSAGKGGEVDVLGDYVNGFWAYDGRYPVGTLENGYARAIAALADEISQGATEPPPQGGPSVTATATWIDGSAVAVPTQEEIGYPVIVDWTDYVGPDRALADIEWWVEHDTEGYHSGDLATLHSHAGSAHALIDRDGALTFMVPITKTAWTPGNDPVAQKSVNVENDGFRDGRNGGYTAAQLASNAAFYRWCVARGMMNVPAVWIGRKDADGGPLPDVPGMLGHEDVPNPNVPGAWGGAYGHTDPGPLWNWNGFIALCTGTNPNPGPNNSATYRLFKETGHGIDGGFKAWWEGLPDPLGIAGFPVTEEFEYMGRTTQAFQRLAIQWFPENRGTPYEFQTLLLGSAFAKAQGYSGPGIP